MENIDETASFEEIFFKASEEFSKYSRDLLVRKAHFYYMEMIRLSRAYYSLKEKIRKIYQEDIKGEAK